VLFGQGAEEGDSLLQEVMLAEEVEVEEGLIRLEVG